ncbi:hypothetical protein ABPG74_011407 [Tetrahymena malaccensis]
MKKILIICFICTILISNTLCQKAEKTTKAPKTTKTNDKSKPQGQLDSQTIAELKQLKSQIQQQVDQLNQQIAQLHYQYQTTSDPTARQRITSQLYLIQEQTVKPTKEPKKDDKGKSKPSGQGNLTSQDIAEMNQLKSQIQQQVDQINQQIAQLHYQYQITSDIAARQYINSQLYLLQQQVNQLNDKINALDSQINGQKHL